ncbi:MAG: translation initiation factor IF-3 [Candidatus Pacebacteria bacterium]|nr:translation initiation factor IF-3 [Candidatus Paceibacterota bacterium]
MNESIRASQLRVIDPEEGNLGIISTAEAIKIAQKRGLDLIEISSDTVPPIAKIMDYGQYQYEQKKKQKDIKAKQKNTSAEVKDIQVKIGTGENDLTTKANRATEWLKLGHRVKIELYLRGRSKFLEKNFLEERLERILGMLTVEYKKVDAIKPTPKGIMITIDPANKK